MAEDNNLTKYLDTYGYAALAASDPQRDLPAMQALYGELLPDDPIIAMGLSNVGKVEKAEMEHQIAVQKYKATDKDKRGEKPEFSVDSYLEKSYKIFQEAIVLYNIKRNDILTNLGVDSAIDYFSRKDGKPILEIPDSLLKLAKGTSKKVGDLEKKDPLNQMIGTFDRYKIHGEISMRLERKMAEGRLENIADSLKPKEE